MEKKSQLGAGIAWIAGSFAVFLILLICIFMISTIGVFEREKVDVLKGSRGDTILLNQFYSFLDSKTVIENQTLAVKDLIALEPEDNSIKYDYYLELSNSFLDNYIMKEKDVVTVPAGNIKRAWLRIYSYNESIRQYSSRGYVDKYIKYELYRGTDSSHTLTCDPENYKNSVLFYYLPQINKKVVLCLEYNNGS